MDVAHVAHIVSRHPTPAENCGRTATRAPAPQGHDHCTVRWPAAKQDSAWTEVSLERRAQRGDAVEGKDARRRGDSHTPSLFELEGELRSWSRARHQLRAVDGRVLYPAGTGVTRKDACQAYLFISLTQIPLVPSLCSFVLFAQHVCTLDVTLFLLHYTARSARSDIGRRAVRPASHMLKASAALGSASVGASRRCVPNALCAGVAAQSRI